MDTSQAHLSSKAGTKDQQKPEQLSKEELTAVLKYGAQKMYVLPVLISMQAVLMVAHNSFDKDDSQQTQKLDQMDLDDILNRAEDHETIQGAEGASLGGEGFLSQFASVSDIKNDMSWEDIIPLEERQRFEREEDEKKAEELAAQESRKRTHAQVSYEGMDVDQPPPSAPPKKPKAPGPTRKTASQKAMELKERDVRVLVRSIQHWGDIRLRYDIIVSQPHPLH
jgi:chromodomain-helicase-DNA-binding protein 1